MRADNRILPYVILGVWGLFVLWGIFLILYAPKVWLTERVEVELKPGGAVDLGRASLGLTEHDHSTAARHLRIERDKKGGWRFYGLSRLHRLDVRTDRIKTLYVPRMKLEPGDKIGIGGHSIRVVGADDAQGLVLQDKRGDRATWNGEGLKSQRHETYLYCHHKESLSGRMAAWLDSMVRGVHWWMRNYHPTKELTLFSLGGQVQCSDRWMLKGVPLEAARIYWREGAFYLGGLDSEVREEIVKANERRGRGLEEFYLPFDGPEGRVNRLVLGRTYFQATVDGDRMVLQPVRNLPLAFDEPQSLNLPQGVSLQLRTQSWTGANPPAMPGPLRWILFVVLLLISQPFAFFLLHLESASVRGNTIWKVWLSLLPAWLLLSFSIAGWSALNANLAAGLFLCAGAWLMATNELYRRDLLVGTAGFMWLLLLLLAGIGALNMVQLAAGGSNTKWLSHASGQLAVLTFLAAVTALAARLPAVAWRNLIGHFVANRGPLVKGIKTTLLAAVVLLIGAQFFVGDEKGLGWIQPVEFVKLTMILMLASTLTHLRWMRFTDSKDFRNNYRKRIVMLLLTVAVFGLATAVIMLGVHDNSPLVIVGAVTLPYIWLAATDPLRSRLLVTWLVRATFVLLPLISVLLLSYWLWQNPPDYLSAIPQAERFRIWSDPWGHRLSGDQVIQSLLRVREGGWTGVTAWFGANGPVMSLPAVQDDFIAAFLVNRFGGYAALTLITVQLLWCLGLMTIARRLMEERGAFEEYRSRYWLGAVLFGLAWMQVAHWCISWGNVLGLLPVMGQPMTWLSSGKSHMLAVAFPSLVLGLIGAWILKHARQGRFGLA